jgi:hypothetical protein
MSDAGEGLIDAESRIQERMEEVVRERSARLAAERNPQQLRAVEALESLKLARIELRRQLAATAHEARRFQLTHALEELDRRIAETSLLIG